MVLRPRSPCLCVLSGPAGNLLTCRGSAQVSPSCLRPQGGRETSWHSSGACTQLLYVTIPSHCPTPSTMPTLTRSSWATNPHLKDGLLRLRRASHMLGLGTQCPARQQEPQKSWWPAQEMQWPTADWLRGLQALLRKCREPCPGDWANLSPREPLVWEGWGTREGQCPGKGAAVGAGVQAGGAGRALIQGRAWAKGQAGPQGAGWVGSTGPGQRGGPGLAVSLGTQLIPCPPLTCSGCRFLPVRPSPSFWGGKLPPPQGLQKPSLCFRIH